ncbi:quinoprotein dehydrogenase-associated probable ABC transporter substrate-binding protein [Glaciimonas immobilis]|uniref:Quinoprotein dehydrogenase-associated probable ABC transporter substrate-binding protein n=1 Tax=Glaciimonas immobilis TaxID=728004 RepID=A0A840RSS3_9BURK|nr:substrate-binding domain-containing protein [Glaciimonas immobilis]MBB5201567.1 quinoprotein dehydrogenase-associated probable ABC transporter substrate-binding protein [Glaciimonas immobilis]
MASNLTMAEVPAPEPEHEKVLRVCQDPNNMPFSNQKLMGFENKIAALFAKELGWKIEYTWYPQRMGYVRNTLKKKLPDSDQYECDLVTGVAVGFDLGATTRPYYHSTYSMAYVKGKGFDDIKTPDDLLKLDPARLKTLRLGVFGRSPVVDWMLKNGLADQMVSYQTQTGDPAQYPGEMVEKDLTSGKIDVAFVWGPIGGYFAKKATTVPIAAIPFKSQPNMRMDFSIAMGVRYGEKGFKDRIDQLIAKNQPQITAILREYGVLLVDDQGNLLVSAN